MSSESLLTRTSVFIPVKESKESRRTTAEDTRNRQRWNRVLFNRLERLVISKPSVVQKKKKKKKRKVNMSRLKRLSVASNHQKKSFEQQRRPSTSPSKKRMSLPKGLLRPSDNRSDTMKKKKKKKIVTIQWGETISSSDSSEDEIQDLPTSSDLHHHHHHHPAYHPDRPQTAPPSSTRTDKFHDDRSHFLHLVRSHKMKKSHHHQQQQPQKQQQQQQHRRLSTFQKNVQRRRDTIRRRTLQRRQTLRRRASVVSVESDSSHQQQHHAQLLADIESKSYVLRCASRGIVPEISSVVLKTPHKLCLSGRGLTDPSLKAIAKMHRRNRTLYAIDLHDNVITDDGISYLLRRMSRTVRELDLSRNRLGRKNLCKDLRRVLESSAHDLRELSIASNSLIGDRGISVLIQSFPVNRT